MERARTTLGRAWHSEDVHGGQEGSQFCQADRGITEVVCEVLVLYVVLWSLRATNSYNSLVRHACVHCCSIDNRSAFSPPQQAFAGEMTVRRSLCSFERTGVR